MLREQPRPYDIDKIDPKGPYAERAVSLAGEILTLNGVGEQLIRQLRGGSMRWDEDRGIYVVNIHHWYMIEQKARKNSLVDPYLELARIMEETGSPLFEA